MQKVFLISNLHSFLINHYSRSKIDINNNNMGLTVACLAWVYGCLSTPSALTNHSNVFQIAQPQHPSSLATHNHDFDLEQLRK